MFSEGSRLFDLVRQRKIPHPTDRRFDPALWREAHDRILSPSRRDDDLLALALFVGEQLRLVRAANDTNLAGLGPYRGRVLGLAMANVTHRVMAERQDAALRSAGRTDGVVDLEATTGRRMSAGIEGNDLSGDDLTDTLVDTLPHWLAAPALQDAERPASAELGGIGRRALRALSIETSLTGLWQLGLWNGWRLDEQSPPTRFGPSDRRFETLRHAWVWRQQAITSQRSHLDLAQDKALQVAGGAVTHEFDRFVAGVVRDKDGSRHFRIARTTESSKRRLGHLSEASLLRSSYLSEFLDTELYLVGMTPYQLCRVWWVLADAAEVLAERLPRRASVSAANMHAWALVVPRKALVEALMACCDLDKAAATRALAFLEYDPVDGTSFRRGLWSRPLVPVSGTEVAMCLPVLRWGSTVRRVEGWILRVNATGELSGSERGLGFEARARIELRAAMRSNPLLAEARCLEASLVPDEAGVGDIDVLFLLGGLLVVGEVKCLVTPGEPLEYHNYGRKLRHGAGQALRKANWVDRNRAKVAAGLGVPHAAISGARIVRLVVVNQGFGTSLEVDGARVVDLHFLRLYLSSSHIRTGAEIHQDDGSVQAKVGALYASGEEAVRLFESTMANPPTLTRYVETVEWYGISFPTMPGGTLLVEGASRSERGVAR